MQCPRCQHENRAGAKFCEVHDSHDIRRAGALSRGLRGRSEASHALVTKSPLSLTRTSRQARDKDEGRPNASLHAQRIPSPSQRPPCQLPERPAWRWTSPTRLPAPPAGTTRPPQPPPRCQPMPSPLRFLLNGWEAVLPIWVKYGHAPFSERSLPPGHWVSSPSPVE